MLILPQKVKMIWTNSIKKRYIEKGYTFTRIGDIFEVDVLDLSPSSDRIILVKCDFCHDVKPMIYARYTRDTKNHTKNYGCKSCSLAKAISKYEGITEKICKQCGINKPLDDFEKVKSGNPRSICRECRKQVHRATAMKREVQMEGTQVCIKCKKEKQIEQFVVERSKSNGRSSTCRICAAEAKQERRKEHRKSLTDEFFNDRAASLNNAPRSMEINSKVTGAELKMVFLKQEKQCYYCKVQLNGFNVQFDHMLPISRGGIHDISNISACCFACNRLKMERTVEEFKIFLIKYTKRVIEKWG